MQLSGTLKQIKYAEGIIANWSKNYPDVKLPNLSDSQFWINTRSGSLQEMLQKAKELTDNVNYASNIFTSGYPKHSRHDSIQALKTLSWDKVVTLDSETSGLTKGSEIIELSIVRNHDRKILFNSLLQPHDYEHYGLTKQTEKAAKVNGIAVYELRTAPTLPDVWEDIINILQSHQIIVYNVGFDLPMLQRSALSWGLTMPKLYATCAMLAFQHYMESPDYFSLEDACNYFNIDRSVYGETHRSLADVLATIELVNCMLAEGTQHKQAIKAEPQLIKLPFSSGNMLPLVPDTRHKRIQAVKLNMNRHKQSESNISMTTYTVWQKYAGIVSWRARKPMNTRIMLGEYDANSLIQALSQASKDTGIPSGFLSGKKKKDKDE